MKVEFFRHNLEPEDFDALRDVCQSIFLTTGPVTRAFEEAYCKYTGLPNVVTVSSCTAALHLSYLALGIGPGDEVIVPAMTFIATATAVEHAGARPVLVDVEPETGLIDPAQVEAAITPRTKAICPVHLYGSMADIRALRRIADARGLKIIEDCAHGIECERDGVRPGHLGDTACYSFYATKNLACGEGGAVGCRDAELAARLRRLRLHGMSKDAASRYTGTFQHWDMVELGWKYNLDDIHSALLVRQLPRLDRYLTRREQLARAYDEAFSGLRGVEIPRAPGKSARHLYTIWVDEDRRDEILTNLQQRGLGVAVNYRAIHTLKYFRETFGYRASDFPNALRIGARTLSLPLYSKLTDVELAYVVQSVREAIGAHG